MAILTAKRILDFQVTISNISSVGTKNDPPPKFDLLSIYYKIDSAIISQIIVKEAFMEGRSLKPMYPLCGRCGQYETFKLFISHS